MDEFSGTQQVSLRTMARRMNVAVSTVSRALAGDPRISSERAAEIRDLADRLGYRPRPLRRRRANAIALIIASQKEGVADDLYQQLVTLHVEQASSEFQNHVHVEFVLRHGAAAYPSVLRENRVDGVILAGHPSVELCQRVREEGIPVVVLNDTIRRTGCTSVITDFVPGTSEAVCRLVELGHWSIGFVASRREYPSVGLRLEAYQRVLADCGLDAEDTLVVEGFGGGVAAGREGVRELLRREPPPTAIVFTNDWMAIGGMNELMRQGYRIPQDMSLVGHDNVSLCDELEPALTSVDGGVEELTKMGVELLQEQIEGHSDAPVQERVPGRLVWRDSCTQARRQEL